MTETVDKVRENKARRWAKRLGLELRRSRVRLPAVDDHGLYRLETNAGKVVAGQPFDLTMAAVEAVLADHERQILAERGR